jgi:hypothetical protein
MQTYIRASSEISWHKDMTFITNVVTCKSIARQGLVETRLRDKRLEQSVAEQR